MSSSQEDLFSRPTQDNAVVTATTGLTQDLNNARLVSQQDAVMESESQGLEEMETTVKQHYNTYQI